MRRVLSLILVSVMLLSTVLMCRVDAKAAGAEVRPFYMTNFSTVNTKKFPNIWKKAEFSATRKETEVTVSYNGKTGISAIAKRLKDDFDKYPDNANVRIINITAVERLYLSEQTEDVIFMETGTQRLAAWMDEFLAEYARIGGKLDGIHSDLEYISGYNWYLYDEQFNKGNTDVYNNIVNNPNYLTKVRLQLEARGFKFYPASTNKARCEIYSIHPYSGDEYNQSRLIWDAVMKNMMNAYLDECLYAPTMKHFPNAIVEDWQSADTYGWMKEIHEYGRKMYLGGNYNKVGNYSSCSFYNYAPSFVTTSASSTSYKKPVSYNGAVCEDNAFNMTMWEVISYKNVYAAANPKQISVCLTYFDYGQNFGPFKDNHAGTSSGTPYHVESYFHAGLLDANFGGYIYDKNTGSTTAHMYRLEVVSAILNELTRLVGYADRKPIETPTNWNDSFILSGMYANGRNIWRVTPDTVTGVSKKDFLVKNDGEVIFSNKGQTILFPKGSIIEDSSIPAVGTCGYWVATPANVMPFITSDENRYDQYPAFSEEFDNYKTGIEFNSSTAKYTHTWNSSVQSNSSVTIQESKSNTKDKVLAIQGNASLNSVKVPQYITAGDAYAKQQAWEISFNLSALPTGNAEIKLLNATSGSSGNVDGGFRIYNGKLYYGPTDNYKAFANLSLAANTEYTVKRVLDLRNADALTCSYYVYDAKGNLLDKAENVAMPTLKLPIEKIGISTENFGTNTVYLDDFKLSALGLTTDLEIYNADTGILVADASARQNTNTAYRLSWMNASTEAKCYNVVASFSDGSKQTLKSVLMMPGCDGVDTGIVKVNGKAVRISLEEGEVKIPTPPVYEEDPPSGGTTNGGNTSGGNTSGGNTNGGNTNGGNTNGGNTNGGNTNGGNTNGGNTNGGNTNGGTTNEGTTNEGTTNEGTTNEGTTNEGNTNEGTTNEGTTNEGTTNEGTTNEGNTNEGTTNEGTTNEGTTNEGTTNEGTTNEGNTNEGTTNEGTTNEGTTNEGTANGGNTNHDDSGSVLLIVAIVLVVILVCGGAIVFVLTNKKALAKIKKLFNAKSSTETNKSVEPDEPTEVEAE